MMNSINELLLSLVSIPSVNPSYGGSGEEALQKFVVSWLEERGIAYRLQEVADGRRNVICRLGDPAVPATLIDAHLDTVGVEGWKMGDPFTPAQRDGRIYARGACDTKASLAVFMSLLDRFNRSPVDLKRPLVFCATVDEESEQRGAYELAKLIGELNIGAAIAGEPTRSDIVTRHKGIARYRIVSSGLAAHSSVPSDGANAIYAAAKACARLEVLGEDLLGRYDSFIEAGSLNVGKIDGGTGFNVVPDRCVLELDRRIGVAEDPAEVRGEVVRALRGIDGIAVEETIARPSLDTGSKDPFCASLMNAAQEVGIGVGFREVAYMTNAVAYSALGLPAVVFGPGDIAQAHKVDEFIEVSELERSYRILEQYFSS